ncbi:oligosaccharide flippase family protein [Acinetobacter johnsonii]|nr:oligosaccharide flippase family protein [Acinetobacter johnsonii]
MKSKELKEVGYLYLIQIVNFVLPVFLMTYLVKILGLDGYGKLSFYQISSLLMIFIVDFGFNQSSAQKFAVSDAGDRDKIFNNTQSIKFFISIFIIIFTVFFYLLIFFLLVILIKISY